MRVNSHSSGTLEFEYEAAEIRQQAQLLLETGNTILYKDKDGKGLSEEDFWKVLAIRQYENYNLVIDQSQGSVLITPLLGKRQTVAHVLSRVKNAVLGAIKRGKKAA